MFRIIALTLLVGLLMGCSTMRFINSEKQSNVEESFWHHNTLFSLVEVSKPINPEIYCVNGWAEVYTQESWGTAVVPFLISIPLSALSPKAGSLVNFLWDPQNVGVICQSE